MITLPEEKLVQLRMWAIDRMMNEDTRLPPEEAVEQAELLVKFVLGES